MATKRLQVDMSERAYERLREAAEEQDTSVAEFVRRAINVDLFLRDKAAEDGTVTVNTTEGTTSILVR